jgi:DNA repair protein RadC
MKTIRKIEIRSRRVSLAAESSEPYGEQISSPSKAHEIAQRILGSEAHEVFVALLLDIRNKVIAYTEVARGTVDACPVDVRAAFRAVVAEGASGVIFAHNHPSGDPSPSAEDLALTERLRKAAEIIGCTVTDHVIVTGSGDYFSFRQEGLIR